MSEPLDLAPSALNETIYGDFPPALGLIVSRDTRSRLCRYLDLLARANDVHNLVAAPTLAEAWNRHILDSAQLFPLVPIEALTLADMGSGAGFPGLVLAILAKAESRALRVNLIESTNKKADFLQTVATDLGLDVTIRRERVETIRDLKADIITARALKPLPDLLPYAHHLWHKDSVAIFPKGRKADEELTQARKSWTFDLDRQPSASSPDSSILILRNLRYKTRR